MTSTEAAPPVVPPSAPPPDGALDALMTKWLGRSWRTGIAARALFITVIISGVNVAMPGVIPQIVVAVATVLAGAITAAGLNVAKDEKVSGLPK